MLRTRVGLPGRPQIAVSIGSPAPNGEVHWSTEQAADGWPVGCHWEPSMYSAIVQGVWHGIDVDAAARGLQRYLDERRGPEDLMIAIDHYTLVTQDFRAEDFHTRWDAETD